MESQLRGVSWEGGLWLTREIFTEEKSRSLSTALDREWEEFAEEGREWEGLLSHDRRIEAKEEERGSEQSSIDFNVETIYSQLKLVIKGLC